MREQAPGPHAVHEETHSALRWPLLAWGLYGPAAAVTACAVCGATIDPLWFLAAVFLPLFPLAMIGIALLYRNWPTGIRIDASGIAVGAIGSPRAAGRNPTVTHQAWTVFTCPWVNVRSVRVVTDPRELGPLRKSPEYYTLTNRWGGPLAMTHCQLGVLVAPFMRAALVVDFDAAEGTEPAVRPARYYTNGKNGRMSVLIEPAPGHTWIVPTRNPDSLRHALSLWASPTTRRRRPPVEGTHGHA